MICKGNCAILTFNFCIMTMYTPIHFCNVGPPVILSQATWKTARQQSIKMHHISTTQPPLQYHLKSASGKLPARHYKGAKQKEHICQSFDVTCNTSWLDVINYRRHANSYSIFQRTQSMEHAFRLGQTYNPLFTKIAVLSTFDSRPSSSTR